MYEYMAKVVRVIDGDTVEVDIDLGFRITSRMICRLYGINAPEMRGPSRVDGESAKMYLMELLHRYQQNDECLKIRTEKDSQEKYGRYLATLMIGDVNLNQLMLSSGHAVFADYR